LLCCCGVSKSLSRPKGVDDRWPSEILTKTSEWLANAEKEEDPRLVIHSQYQWPEVNPVELKVPDVKGKDLYLQI